MIRLDSEGIPAAPSLDDVQDAIVVAYWDLRRAIAEILGVFMDWTYYDPALALALGFQMPAKGWPPAGNAGDRARNEYQALLKPLATKCQAIEAPRVAMDPKYWVREAERIGRAAGLPAGMLGSIVWHESRGKPWLFNFGSSSGGFPSTAIGLGQVTGSTAKACGMPHSFDPRTNLVTAARALLLKYRKRGTWNGALASYAGKPEPYTGRLLDWQAEFGSAYIDGVPV